MKLETRFSCGDKFWAITADGVEQLTVGQVSVEHTESPGLDGETMFDNFKACYGHREWYMAVETGIGSGNVYYLGDGAYATEEEAVVAKKLREQRRGRS